MTTTTTLRDAALDYARRGWPVFPIRWRDAETGMCSCRSVECKNVAKHPLTPHGFKDATTNVNVIERWWDRWPEANVGVPTGQAIRAWVLDVDGEGGSRSLTALETELGALPETLEAQTGSGGRHLFFALPTDRAIGNRQATNKRTGIDVRGEGGYVIAPPSLHRSGRRYEWPLGPGGKIAVAPKAWLDFVAPLKPALAPWERVAPSSPHRPPPLPPSLVRTPIVDRAKLYLSECDPAIQGQGGHNALLWAARALVVGFELSDETAISLLWSDYNPRCRPPWDASNETERRDFERKVSQARATPSEKKPGWLLDELGLRSSAQALASIARGQQLAQGLLAAHAAKAVANPEPIDLSEPEQQELPQVLSRRPFPLEAFPAPIGEFIRAVAESHVVDPSMCGLPALGVAGAAMGGAWRLQLKGRFLVPPALWVAIVANSGTNKSGPLREIVAPLRKNLTVDQIPDPMLNPQGQAVVSDATLEAVVVRLRDAPRGLLVFRDELAGWVKGFNAYRKGGGADEAAWLEFWGGGEYTVDRKTAVERIHSDAALAGVLGGIQPKVLVDCFDPAKFASGLVPRILITCPPQTEMFWSEAEVDPAAEARWHSAITWLRTTPFVALDANAGRYLPRVARFSTEARACYAAFHNAMELEIHQTTDENARAFISKARLQAARLALIHHGLRLACEDRDLTRDVGLASVEAAALWARWCLEEQIRVYGFGAKAHREQSVREVVAALRRHPTPVVTTRQVQRLRKFESAGAARAVMTQLVELGHARWADESKNKLTLNPQEKTT